MRHITFLPSSALLVATTCTKTNNRFFLLSSGKINLFAFRSSFYATIITFGELRKNRKRPLISRLFFMPNLPLSIKTTLKGKTYLRIMLIVENTKNPRMRKSKFVIFTSIVYKNSSCEKSFFFPSNE